VLITGGWYGGAIGSAELFDPQTDQFEALSVTMGAERWGAMAAPLPDGDILIAGGLYNGGTNSSAEVFRSPPQPSWSGGAFGAQTVGQSAAQQTIAVTNVDAQSRGRAGRAPPGKAR
jgi:hypothetical protein